MDNREWFERSEYIKLLENQSQFVIDSCEKGKDPGGNEIKSITVSFRVRDLLRFKFPNIKCNKPLIINGIKINHNKSLLDNEIEFVTKNNEGKQCLNK